MILCWLDLIFQFGLVVDDIQLSSWQWPVYKKLYPVWPPFVTTAACTLPSGCWCPPLTSVSAQTAEHNVSLGDTCPASSGATAEAPDYSDLE